MFATEPVVSVIHHQHGLRPKFGKYAIATGHGSRLAFVGNATNLVRATNLLCLAWRV